MSGHGLPLLLAGAHDDIIFLRGRLQVPTLPDGVLSDIVSRLDLRDLLACRLVNKAWSRAAAAAVRHVDLPCKVLATAASTASGTGRRRMSRGPGVDAALRRLYRLHRVWPKAEAVTLSNLAAGQAVHAELSLQVLANHLTRWRYLRQLNLRDMPVSAIGPMSGAPAPAAQAPDGSPATIPPRAPVAATTGVDAYGGGRIGGGPGARGYIGGVPGPWDLDSLSCCLGLSRLEVELVPAKERPPAPAAVAELLSPSETQSQRQRRQQRGQRPDAAQLAAGQAALLEGLTRLTRLTHLSLRLLDLPAAVEATGGQAGGPATAGGAAEPAAAGSAKGAGTDSGEGPAKGEKADAEAGTGPAAVLRSGSDDTQGPPSAGPSGYVRGLRTAAAVVAAEAQRAAAEAAMAVAAAEYVLDAEEAGSYETDLVVGLGSGLASGSDPDRAAAAAGATAVAQVQSEEVGDQSSSVSSDEDFAALFASDSSSTTSSRRGEDDGAVAQAPGDDAAAGGAADLAVGAAAGPGPAAAAAAAAASRAAARNWTPQPSLFIRLGSKLRSLRLAGCDLRGGGALAELTSALTGLTTLSLQGRLGVSHGDLASLSRLRYLQDLSLSRVELLYDPRDPDDCPVALMTEMYGALQQLRRFQSLRFELANSGGSGIHSAHLLQLYDQPLARLRSLHLSTVVLDSDYSFHMLAELTSLTSFTMTYVTWPLALHTEDMTLLAPLSGLRRFCMHCEPSERHHLISLNGRVVEVLAGAWTHLTQLAFTGQILPDTPGAPSLRSLSTWTSLRDLSLSVAPDDDRHHFSSQQANPDSRRAPRPRPRPDSDSDSDSEYQGDSDGDDVMAGMSYLCGGAGLYNDDEEAAAAAAGALDLGVSLGCCLPPGLTRLALGGLRLRGEELLGLLGGSLTGLTSLQVLDCGLTPAHLMVGDIGATQLQELVLNDSRSWSACRSSPAQSDHDCSAQRSNLPYASGRAAAARRHQELFASARGSGESCYCCCSPSVWGSTRCLTGSRTARKTVFRKSLRAAARRASVAFGLGGGGWGSGSSSGSDGEWGEGWGGATAGAGACGCWRQRLIRHGLASLQSLRSLEFLLLGLPDDELPAEDVLEPLKALTGLRCLTLRARGMVAGNPVEVSEPLRRLARLRSLHLTGPRPDSAAALGAEEAARRLQYL
ncbi:hypothetical protein PLESTB_001739800 [Pleodorina starrii]|uniref:F-box domain-containing protein n=1 Tax=Pleodorina starrii TaxID=330485 RepID=A0A9W6F9D7_9CHLO|nr:hypothetical protein PLESTM_000747900 [Pleodorina starrii]GLC61287.1 hypothetical protein PLESTB_001739800 [Pleodorina starrii]